MEKLHLYQGWIGRFHEWRDSVRTKYSFWRENHPESLMDFIKNSMHRKQENCNEIETDYSHIYR